MKRAGLTLAAITLLAAPLAAQEEKSSETQEKPRPRIEIAILLDTSGSMDGLINQARTYIWSIVNRMATAKKDGRLPDLRLALYEYGKSSLPAEQNQIRRVIPLTDNLDKIAEELFALKTNGGKEYCGLVIRRAVKELEWSEGDHYRAIFIAGNEPFTQGPVDYKEACKAAIEKGIIVNTIHCGKEQAGRNGMWHEGARLADGSYVTIDQNAKRTAIKAPQDKKIAELNAKLNDTYVAYGDEGRKAKKRQKDMDKLARDAAPSSMAERAQAKGGPAYRNSTWDLVDAVEDGKVKLEDLKDEELPEEMRGMSLEEKKAYVEKKSKERKEIRGEIKKLVEERKAYVAKKRKEMAEESEETLDKALGDLLEKQLEKKGYEVEKK